MRFSCLPLSVLTLNFAYTIAATSTIRNDADTDEATVNIFAVDYPIVAYIANSGKHHAATTYHIACSSDTPVSSCPFAQPYTLIQGSSTLSFEFTAPQTATATASAAQLTQSFTLGCKIDSTTSLGCSATGLAEGIDSPVTTSQIFTFTGTAAQAFFKEVQVVTKTEDLLTYTPGATSSSAKATITGDSDVNLKVGGAMFFEGKSVVTSTAVVVAEKAIASSSSSSSSSATIAVQTTSGSGRLLLGRGLLLAGCVVLGLVWGL